MHCLPRQGWREQSWTKQWWGFSSFFASCSIKQQLPSNYSRTLQANLQLPPKGPPKHSNQLLKPNIIKDWKRWRGSEWSCVCVSTYHFFRPECSFSLSHYYVLYRVFHNRNMLAYNEITILEFTSTEKCGFPWNSI